MRGIGEAREADGQTGGRWHFRKRRLADFLLKMTSLVTVEAQDKY